MQTLQGKGLDKLQATMEISWIGTLCESVVKMQKSDIFYMNLILE